MSAESSRIGEKSKIQRMIKGYSREWLDYAKASTIHQATIFLVCLADKSFVMAKCQSLFTGDLIKYEYNLTTEIMMNICASGVYSQKPNEERI